MNHLHCTDDTDARYGGKESEKMGQPLNKSKIKAMVI